MQDSGLAGRLRGATTTCLPHAHPAHQLGDEGIVGGVVTTVGVGQEVVTQHTAGSVGADHRRTGHRRRHEVPFGSASGFGEVAPVTQYRAPDGLLVIVRPSPGMRCPQTAWTAPAGLPVAAAARTAGSVGGINGRWQRHRHRNTADGAGTRLSGTGARLRHGGIRIPYHDGYLTVRCTLCG